MWRKQYAFGDKNTYCVGAAPNNMLTTISTNVLFAMKSAIVNWLCTGGQISKKRWFL